MSDYLKKPVGDSVNAVGRARALDQVTLDGKSLPARVVKVIGPRIVTVSFEVNGRATTLPQVTVPVECPPYIYYPIAVGDLGKVSAADARLGGVTGLGSGVARLDRPANLAALSFTWLGNTADVAPVDPEAVEIFHNIIVKQDALGFFATPPVTQKTVVGALTAITDANAKAVLTSLITGLADYGLIIKGTT